MLRVTEKIILGINWKFRTKGMEVEANMPLTILRGKLDCIKGEV